jgi:hypothetical protein
MIEDRISGSLNGVLEQTKIVEDIIMWWKICRLDGVIKARMTLKVLSNYSGQKFDENCDYC